MKNQEDGTWFLMKHCGLTEWLVMGPLKRLPMNWFMGIMLHYHGNYGQVQGELLQKELVEEDYKNLMMDELEDLHLIRLKALENIEKNKIRAANGRFGEEFTRAINGRFLKKYYPSVEVGS